MDFTCAFVAIPLPDEFGREFGQIAGGLTKKYPALVPADLGIPHITLYFLGNQSEETLKEARKAIARHLGLLAGVRLDITGVGTFGDDKPRVLYIDVKQNSGLKRFQKAISDELQAFREPDKRSFTPHLTIGRIGDKDRDDFYKVLPKINKELKKVSFEFPVNVISIYGIDKKKSQSEERLFDIVY